MEDLKHTIAQNLAILRKKSQMTQIQLAEKLNYSDKAISKWEKGDCVPNIFVLMQLASFYGVSIEDIVYEKKEIKPKNARRGLRTIVTLLSSSLVWLIATIVFVVLNFIPGFVGQWLSFIIAIPVFFLVLLVFCAIWRNYVLCAIFSSFFVWTAILAISLLFNTYQIWYIYFIGVPLQIIIFLIFALIYLKHRLKI